MQVTEGGESSIVWPRSVVSGIYIHTHFLWNTTSV